MTSIPWVFTMSVNTPKPMRAPGLHDPDNWNLQALDEDEWSAAALVADEVEKELRGIAPADTTIERNTRISVQITTPAIDWFQRWYTQCPHADLVVVYQTPKQPATGDDLYMYDKEGRV